MRHRLRNRTAQGVFCLVTLAVLLTSPTLCAAADTATGLKGVTALQRALEYDFRRGRAAPEARMEALYGQACADRVRFACQWRTWHRKDHPPRRDTVLVFSRPCKAGEGVACLAAAWARQRSPGGHGEVNRSLAAGCRLGVQRACAERAQRQLDGLGMVADLPAASRALERTCKAGAWTGCVGLADALDRGAGLPLNRARALMLWHQACGAGELEGCHRYASRQAAGDGLVADAAAAAVLWRAACDGGHANSCVQLAVSLRQGRGVTQDARAADARQRRACELDLPSACPSGRSAAEPPETSPKGGPAVAMPLPDGSESPLHARPGWHPPVRRQSSYANWLAAGYVVGPLLAALTNGAGLLTPPIVHWVHGEGARGLAASGALIFLPLLSAGVAASIVCGDGVNCDEGNANASLLISAAATYVAWAVYDCAHNATTTTYSRTGWQLAPYVRHDPQMGATLGLGGAF